MPHKFTQFWIDSLRPPDAGRVEYYDTTCTGLCLRITAKGTMSWLLQYRAQGAKTMTRYTIGRYPLVSLREARERADDHLAQVRRGEDPWGDRQASQNAPTFAKMAAEYLDLYARPRKRSVRLDEQIIRADLVPAWGGMKAHEIKRRDVIALLDAIKERGAPIQANRALACIRKIYNWAISRDLVEANPCAQVKAPSQENQRDRVLSEGEIRAIWRALDADDPHMAALFRLHLLTAQRGGEVRTMAWANVDLDAGWWTIPATVAKNRLSHRVPLSSPAVAVLEALPKSSPWVFPGREKGAPLNNASKALYRVRDRSGVSFVPHDLRRTAASHMASMGVPRLVISKILNHVEAGVTRVYDRHSYDREKREAIDAWAERLMAMIG